MDPSATSNTTSASLIRAATVGRVWIELANSSVSARLVTLDHVAKLRYIHFTLLFAMLFFFFFLLDESLFRSGKEQGKKLCDCC